MTVDTAQQLQALCRGLLLGGALGVVYDVMRLCRRRFPRRWLGHLLDFAFWVVGVAWLFVYSQSAWGGEIRLYGAVFCMLGGGAYFWGLSPGVMAAGLWVTDKLERILGILSRPARWAWGRLKGFEKNYREAKK